MTRKHFEGFNYSSVLEEAAAVQCASKHSSNREKLAGEQGVQPLVKEKAFLLEWKSSVFKRNLYGESHKYNWCDVSWEARSKLQETCSLYIVGFKRLRQ